MINNIENLVKFAKLFVKLHDLYYNVIAKCKIYLGEEYEQIKKYKN